MLFRLRRAGGRALRAVGLHPRADVRGLQQAQAAQQRQVARLSEQVTKLRATREDLSGRLAEQGDELERLRAGGASAYREDLSYLFVVTYGRSGSTLLQGILSSTPGVVIRGENGACVASLYEFHRVLTHHRDRLTEGRANPIGPQNAWWGIDGYRTDTSLRNIRTLLLETVLRPAPDTRVVGFKEIDWPEPLPELLAFLREVFPGARFVLNTRDLTAVAASGWWARDPAALDKLRDHEQRMTAAVDALGDAGYHVRFDEYVADPQVLSGLFAWLGEPFDLERVTAVLDHRHSY